MRRAKAAAPPPPSRGRRCDAWSPNGYVLHSSIRYLQSFLWREKYPFNPLKSMEQAGKMREEEFRIQNSESRIFPLKILIIIVILILIPPRSRSRSRTPISRTTPQLFRRHNRSINTSLISTRPCFPGEWRAESGFSMVWKHFFHTVEKSRKWFPYHGKNCLFTEKRLAPVK